MKNISGKNSNEREEGEIVEDELEDVSDCSITPGSPLNSGKSVSPPELLSSVCLSSIDSAKSARTNGRRARSKIYYREPSPCRACKKKRKLRKHALTRKYNRHSRNHKQKYSRDSDSETVDPKYAKQLREALKHESSEEFLQNSLRTRLKGFIDGGSQSDDDDTSLTMLRDLALISTSKVNQTAEERLSSNKNFTNSLNVQNSKNLVHPRENTTSHLKKTKENDEPIAENDAELEALRLAALKSFIIRNHERRKRKAMHNGYEECSNKSSSDIDKENDGCIINNDTDNRQNKKFKPDSEKENGSIENNVKITDTLPDCVGDNIVDHEDNLEDDPDIMRAKLLAAMSTKLTSTSITSEPAILKSALSMTHAVNNLQTFARPMLLKTVKTNASSLILKNNKLPPNPSSAITVKPLIINLNADSDSDTEGNPNEKDNSINDDVTKFLKKQRAEVEASVKMKNYMSPNKSKDLMDKSVIKMLPHSQQLEYFKLKQQMKKRMRLRKISVRLSDTKKDVLANNRKVPRTKTEHFINSQRTTNNKIVKNNRSKGQDSSNLSKALNDLQIRKNGRLQMKGKYQSLVPLLNKITHASNEKHQYEIEIKRLLQEIQKERTRFASAHETFTILVQQLVNEKNKIDLGILKLSKIPTNNNSLFTSTPRKTIVVDKEDTSDIKQNLVVENTELPAEVVEADMPESNVQDKVIEETILSESKTPTDEKIIDLEEKVLLNPNDIDEVFVVPFTTDLSTVPKYISPLDNRNAVNDPLTMYCPYDLSGICKDEECPNEDWDCHQSF